MHRSVRIRSVTVAIVLAATCLVGSASADWRIESKDGESFLKFGFLVQGRAETRDFVVPETNPAETDTGQDLYFRRARLLIGGQMTEKWGFFFETDSPNLGKGQTDGTKVSGDVFVQDWAFNYKHSNAFQVDFGLLLIPFGHNGTQSAASLLPIDYGVFSFLTNAPLDGRVGRDYGVMARGYLLDQHLEYRVGVFDGIRGPNSTNDFRYVGRVVYHIFEPETGRFYSGTNLGKKKILSVGASIDHQEDYDGMAFDVYWDQPIGEGNGVTVQLDYSMLDGDVFVTALPKQNVLYGEAGFYFGGIKLMPYVVFASEDFDDDAIPDKDDLGIGLGYYLAGHNRVLKLQYTRDSIDGGPDLDTITLQVQVFQF